MQYTVNRGEKYKAEIKVDIPKDAFEKTYKDVLVAFGKDAKISGFRPGNAPDDVLESHIGHAKLLNETASFLVSKHIGEILKKEDLVPLDSPQIAVHSLSKGSPFSFTASFIQRPKVKVEDWKKIKVKKQKAKQITDEDINLSVKNIHEAWMKRKTAAAKDTEKKTGDAEEKSKKFIYDAHGEKIFLKDQEEKKSERIGESESKIDDESFDKAQDRPDDQFAKAVGAKDLANLKEIVRRDLESLVSDQAEINFEQAIFAQFLKLVDFEPPEILIEDELNRMIIRLNSELEQAGKKIDEYLKEQQTTVEELKAKWREQAEKNVKVSLILEQIGKDEKIAVEKTEIEAALQNTDQTNLTEEQKKSLENYIAFSIFQAKTLDLVKKTVTV
ncbi:hypothetical protein A2W45_02640 [Candidatus Curtissbacteria bacterium RIFCSPHIGHO2_12_41_11]|uniref:Trigger factor n=2 Tax=Candidatus Curtissiibacteriota TaxID=1752717 RepID=A0A1F5H4Q2_9BACT|nr:MAG: hypothetical protein A3D07_00580 [Candidatus Curtissbacteria bacterium RIFCSPHIGHO2_02_FULL_42_15]OGD99146.1 MAG: hypothetical protein A2W45_02640 [Candidatus Curtissbacteria bacterium RIFCSPHIGHO2_12_41_11]